MWHVIVLLKHIIAEKGRHTIAFSYQSYIMTQLVK